MNMFGLPMVGADVCGFFDVATDELCGRWFQLSVFYPFARNHYNLTNTEPQEAYTLAPPYVSMARDALRQRMGYLRYMYTNLFEAHKFGGTVIRPLFFEYPADEDCHLDYEHTFMVGKALKITPVLQEGNAPLNSYFPKNSDFINLNDLTDIVKHDKKGGNVTLEASFNYTNVHLRAGHIIPFQDWSKEPAETTYDLIEESPIQLIVYPDKNGHAKGTMYIDENGDSLSDLENNLYQYFEFKYSTDNGNTLQILLEDGVLTEGRVNNNEILDEVRIVGVPQFNETDFACVFKKDLKPQPMNLKFDHDTNTLTLERIEGDMILFDDVHAIQWGNKERDTSMCKTQIYVVEGESTYKFRNGLKVEKVVQIHSLDDTLSDLTAKFTLVTDHMVRVEIEENLDGKNVFRVPHAVNDTFVNDERAIHINIDAVLTVAAPGDQFFYEIHASNEPENVFYSTRDQDFIFTDYYKKETAELKTSTGQIFGLGERAGEFWLKEGVYTIWARDDQSPVEDGIPPGKDIYGSHPVYYTQVNNKGFENQFMCVFDNNAGAQDYIITKPETGGRAMTHVKTSGITDKYIILPMDLKDTVEEFTKIIGMPAMVPQWALGWHQCRWGYDSTETMQGIVEQYDDNKFPLDGMWVDIDYMDNYQDFTIGFTGLNEFAQDLHTQKRVFIPIIDAAIAIGDNQAYKDGKEKNLYIKSPHESKKEEDFVGKVWPGPAVYPDWLKPETETYWVEQMKALHTQLDFDGVWLDMNEATNFCDGECNPEMALESSIQDKLFYIPGARDLNTGTIDIDAKHDNGVTEFEAHGTFGLLMGKGTNAYFKSENKRPFILSRSTYSGFGQYGQHWLGDNYATWESMRLSVGGIYLFNMFGIPFTGADICGFQWKTEPEICTRWYQLAALYPFSRNHNMLNSTSQEPYVFDTKIPESEDVTYSDVIRNATHLRYALHQYLYTQVHRSSRKGTPIFKPLFYNFIEDTDSLLNVEENILIGDGIKLTPIMTSRDDSKKVKAEFPGDKNDMWCPLNPTLITRCFNGGDPQIFLTHPDTREILTHIVPGHIIPIQSLEKIAEIPAPISLKGLDDVLMDLAVLPKADYTGRGTVIYDDGETVDINQNTEIVFTIEGKRGEFIIKFILAITESKKADSNSQKLGVIKLYNAKNNGFDENKDFEGTLLEYGQTTGGTPLTGSYNKELDHYVVSCSKTFNLVDIHQIKIGSPAKKAN